MRVNLMQGIGGTAIIGPREVLTFSEWGEPAVLRFRPGQGIGLKWSVTLGDRTGSPGPRPWLVRRLRDGRLEIVIRYERKLRAFDLTTGRLLWTRPRPSGMAFVKSLLPLGPISRFGYE